MTSAPGTKRRARLYCLAMAVFASLACSGPVIATETAASAPRVPASEAYAINLESSTLPLRPSDRPVLVAVKDRQVYVVTVEIRGVTWYRLRMGFFSSKKEAEATLAKYEDQFPDGWVALVDPSEAKKSGGAAVAAPSTAPPPVPPPAGNDGTGLAELMRQAHDAMLVGDYSRAIRLYTKVLESPASPYARDAQELLGLARERNGQLVHARAEYETYLRLYPHGEGTARVRQRLLGLITAREALPKRLRAAQNAGADAQWNGFGSFAQYFRWDQVTSAGSTTSQSTLVSDLDYTARRRGGDYDIRARFSGQYEHDTSGDARDEGRVSALYAEALGSGGNFSGAVGRQSRSDSGLPGRFDGAIVSKPFTPNARLNFFAGLPVDTGTEDRINSHKHFLGVSLDAGNIAGAVDTNTYYIQQEVDGIRDRQAVGAELRYAQEGRNLFTLVDYDLSYASINTALGLIGWSKSDGTALNLILDYRKTPVLATSNALIAQTATTVSALLDTMSESEVRQLAQDRTTLSRSATLSASKPLAKNYLVMGDVTLSSISGTPASGGADEVPATGTETFYSVQLVRNNLVKTGDTTIFGTRYSDAHTANTLSCSVNHRRPMNERVYLNPKLRLDYSEDSTNGDQSTFAAAVRVTRQHRKDLALEGEAGAEWSDRNVSVGSGHTDVYYLFLGFRKDI